MGKPFAGVTIFVAAIGVVETIDIGLAAFALADAGVLLVVVGVFEAVVPLDQVGGTHAF